jgi:hypothetical protein
MNRLPRPCVVLACAFAVFASGALAAAPAGTAADPLSPDTFRNPPRDAGVHAWWHWMDGAITREGITKDLETMKAQGVVQATILNIGLFNDRDLGVPRVPFASPEWFAMYRWAVGEAARLGLTLGVHNCDGWSSSGGPWITPEQSMKQVTWTKTVVTGGTPIEVALPQPAAIAGLYRDIAVVAYRTTRSPSAFHSSGISLQLNGTTQPLGPLVDGNPVSSITIKRGDVLSLSSATPVSFSRVAVHPRRAFMWGDPEAFVIQFRIETSDDGQRYRRHAEITARGLNHNQLLDVPATSTRFVRLTVTGLSETDAWIPVELAELELLRPGETPLYAPAIPHLGEKISSVKDADDGVYVAATDEGAVAPSDVLELTNQMDAAGRLRWSAPAGTWAVLRFGYTSTGATNGPATGEGRGLECDKMDAAALEHHYHAFAEKLIDAAGDQAGKALRFILVDSWEAGFQNWTAALPAEFERHRGYSLIPWLPVLTGEVVGSGTASEAVLHDFRQTIADLIRENYYDRFAALLHARGIELHAEVIYGGAGYPPIDVLQATRHVDLPMLEFWTSANQDSLLETAPVDAPPLDLPQCAAVGYGKTLVGSEAYTGFAHYSEAPADLKPFGDRGYAAGINRMILHSSVHQPTDDRPGLTLGRFASHFNRNNLYWPHAASWIRYQARIQSVLGRGTPDFDVLYFLGDELPQAYTRNGSTTVPAGYAVTAINADLLTHAISVADGRLRLNSHGAAALLSLPPQPVMSFATLQRIDALVRDGAHVYGPKPRRTLSVADAPNAAAFRALADEVWGKVDGQSEFTHAHGRGAVHWGRPLATVLGELGVVPQFTTSPVASKEFLFTHRTDGDTEVFFVVNQTTQLLERECLFRVGAGTPEIGDPETGTVLRPAAFRREAGQLRLPLRFQPRQALLVRFRRGEPARFVTTITRAGTQVFPAKKPAAADAPQLRFDGDGVAIEPVVAGSYQFEWNTGASSAPAREFKASSSLTVTGLKGSIELHGPGIAADAAPLPVDNLRPLTDSASPEVRYFSGEAVYRLKFTVPDLPEGSDQLRLDIGGFESIAEVSLNGEPIGQLWKPGQPLDVTGRLRRDNELTVTVVNVWRNRLIGDLAQFGAIKNLHTSSPLSEFLSAKSPLKRSGLFGPITITRVPAQHLDLSGLHPPRF